MDKDYRALRDENAALREQVANRDQQIVDAQAVISSLGQQKAVLDLRLEAVTRDKRGTWEEALLDAKRKHAEGRKYIAKMRAIIRAIERKIANKEPWPGSKP